MPPPQIILLNGVGSVGKSSTAKALQAMSARPFLHLAMDAFIDMLPVRLIGDPAVFVFETLQDHGKPSIAIKTGPVFDRVMSGMRLAIAAMAAEGNNIIVDDVLVLGSADVADYRAKLAGFDLRVVGLFAHLDILEAREIARGDRAIGLARWQYERVHQGVVYDLEIDTSSATPVDNARLIADAFGL